MAQDKAPQDDFRGIVRVFNTDIKGHYKLKYGLSKIKGIGYRVADFVCFKSEMNPDKKIGYLTQEDISKIEATISGLKDSLPTWMRNRQRDMESGQDIHILTSDLTYTIDNDLKFMKKIRSYRGTRHMFKLPSRGQTTRSNFRKKKKKVTKKR